MKGDIDWAYTALLSVKWQKFPSEIRDRPYGERMFMRASLRFMHDIGETAKDK